MTNIKISSRVKRIIEILCDTDGPITVKEISNKLSVSSRTILREMSEVEKWIISKGLMLDKKPRVGVILKGTIDEKVELKAKLNNEDIDKLFSPKERQSLILSELLQSNEPIKLYYFTTIFKVSEGTVSHDLDKVEKKLKAYNLRLIRKPGLGIYINGSESEFRKAMINLLYEYLDKKQILKIMNQSLSLKNSKENNSVYNQTRNRLLNLIDRETILKLEDIVAQAENDIEYKFADSSYVGLLVHLALAIKRIKNNENITMQKEVLYDLKLSEEFEIAAKIVEKISNEFGINIPEEEIGYVTMHLKGSKIRNVAQRKDDFTIGNFELIKIANKIIKIAEKESGYSIKNDKNLLVGLVSHLQPAITRLNMNMDIRNPLLDNIKNKYLEYFEISKKSVAFLEDKFNKKIPESEIGFITMHLGAAIEKSKNINERIYRVIVTCTSGIGSSKMLATRLEKEYKNLKIVDVISTIEIDEHWIEENGIDFIISTVEIQERFIPVITVTPLLIDSDIEKINTFISQIDKINYRNLDEENKVKNNKNESGVDRINLREKAISLMEYSKAIVDLIDSYFFKEYDKVEDIESLIERICLFISVNEKRRIIIKKDLLKREKSGSTVVKGKGIILIHARTLGVETLKLGVVRLSNPINKLNEDIYLGLIMLAPKDANKKELEVISEISKSLVTVESFSHVLLKEKEKEILNQIEIILSKLLKGRT
ncbi:BglG family transcription antiterminator [Clostridium sediminicola]|uniref:BglG family transcription antiterminator n=1 Tax=Clostridium sediminicola TaxID=3114879 RepID=UPI0031F21B3A